MMIALRGVVVVYHGGMLFGASVVEQKFRAEEMGAELDVIRSVRLYTSTSTAGQSWVKRESKQRNKTPSLLQS